MSNGMPKEDQRTHSTLRIVSTVALRLTIDFDGITRIGQDVSISP